MPHYKKAFDIGTYTGNGGQLRIGIPTLRGVGPSGRQIAGSTRFRLGVPNYLTRTPGSTTSQTTSTWSFWIKKSALATEQEFLTAATSNHSSNPTISYIGFNGSDQLVYYSINNNVMTWYKSTNLAFRDTSVWTHFIVVTDTTNATSSNRIRIYVNGSEVTSWSNDSQPSQNATGFFNSSSATHVIGREAVRNRYPLDGYMSEVYFIDGQALTPSSFGELNSDGIWVPKAYSGTYGTNGFYLPMNSSSNFATDQSGNGNNWTPTGFNTTTANTTYDIMTDSPTDYGTDTGVGGEIKGNYLTLSSAWGSLTLQDGNLTQNSGSAWDSSFSPVILNSGKWYCEAHAYTVSSGGYYTLLGFITGTNPTSVTGNAGSSYLGYTSTSYSVGVVSSSVSYLNNGSATSTSGTFTTSSIIRMAVDVDNGRCWMGADSTWVGGGNPATNTSPTFTFTAGSSVMFGLSSYVGGTKSFINFGQRPFSLTAPSGYKALCTTNISRPADSSLWFYGDTPDLMWIKNRSRTSSHVIQDTVRGINLNFLTDTTSAESSYPYVMEMSKFGMSVQYGTGVNWSGDNFVYYGWKAGSNTSSTSVTNNSGNVTTQVSANPAAGFSIVTYTGTGAVSSGVTLGHGLGATPAFIITKKRSSGTTDYGWSTWHTSLGGNYGLWLNSTASRNPGMWAGYSNFSSTVFTPPDKDYGNVSGETYVNYLWAAIPGYSAFGTYTGTSSTDGPFIYTGFRPKWVMVKAISGATDLPKGWKIFDSARNSYNVMNGTYDTSNNSAEYVDIYFLMDFTSNGFKVRTGAYGEINGSGNGYIYAAFAETPFKFARAR